MAVSQEIIENVKQVRNAAYGKDVREAIAKGLELCYGYTSGETAIEAAERANAAAEAVEGVTAESRETLADLERAVANVDDIVKISENQPTEAENKIWIRPQEDTEYKVATFAAYEALWERMNNMHNVYQQGHGGIVSIVQDTEYDDPEDELKKRYVITYSDETTSEFFVNDGPAGPIGPLDQIRDTKIYYHKGILNNGQLNPKPPKDGWSSDIPNDMSAGDYLWTQTVITYESTAEAYIYGLTLWGKDGVDGDGAVHSFKIGDNGERMVGDIVVPIDSVPTANSSNVLLSGAIYTALQSYAPIQSPTFLGQPKVPTANEGDSSTRIASTEFVQNAINSLNGSGVRKIEITMSSSSFSYLDSSITENTYCLFPNLGPKSGLGKLEWETSNGTLILTSTLTPAQAVTFEVLLIDTMTEPEDD